MVYAVFHLICIFSDLVIGFGFWVLGSGGLMFVADEKIKPQIEDNVCDLTG